MNPNISKCCWGWGGRGAEAAKGSGEATQAHFKLLIVDQKSFVVGFLAFALLSFACSRSQFWWLAAEGEHKLPLINRSGDLKETLQELTTIPKRKILGPIGKRNGYM
ncbi:hypothetical protein V6N12_052428 [Hibiscus sabdariffa]|uniref:Uncharacterized protein n=1 Tax=Hibiscus sabdariffa TaxID=183260 RepID=A0ABR2GI72_9ROSI